MQPSNKEIEALFTQLADLMEIRGDSGFKIRAFRRVSDALEHLPDTAAAMVADGTLKDIPGIGAGALSRIEQILERGSCDDLDQIREEMPGGLLDMLQISGLGPKKVKLFYDQLSIDSVDALEHAAREGHLADLPRMGKKSQDRIIKSIASYRKRTGRLPLDVARKTAHALAAQLREALSLDHLDIAGSTRRGRETIGDLDILVGHDSDAAPIMAYFTGLDQVDEILGQGDTKSSIRLQSGLQVDLRVVPNESFGAALHYFTGSQMHNIAVRDRAKRQGLRVNEYGVFREADMERLGGTTEAEIFNAVGLPWIPPEIRENQGEIEAAEEGKLPDLVTASDLRGDLHVRLPSLDQAPAYIGAAKALGDAYIGLVLPTPAAAGWLEAAQAEQALARLRELSDEDIRVLVGVEVAIDLLGAPLWDGDLASFDLVLAAVHSDFAVDRETMTTRLVNAVSHADVNMLAYPTGRQRKTRPDGYHVDLEPVLRAAKDHHCAIELNGHPERIDLRATHCRQAKDIGVRMALTRDPATAEELGDRDLPLLAARRGWLEAPNLLNCSAVEDIL